MTPRIVYGTAWKKDSTDALVQQALESGFRAVDTANQLVHYSEARVGDALARLATRVPREELWLQTKFTSVDGQDHRLPYDPNADLTAQVNQSFASSLDHLHVSYLDSYLLHGPYNHPGLGDEDFEVWRAMEAIHKTGGARAIGISNVNILQLNMLMDRAEIKPLAVQNRCFADRGWDKDVRDFCALHNIQYQGFSLLTANPHVVRSTRVAQIAAARNVTPAQIILRFASQIGITPLTGTTRQTHMTQDLAIFDFELTPAEVAQIEAASR